MNIGDNVYSVVNDDERPCGLSIGVAEIVEVWQTPKSKQPRYRLRGLNMTHDGCETWTTDGRDYHLGRKEAATEIVRRILIPSMFDYGRFNLEKYPTETIVKRAEDAISIYRKEFRAEKPEAQK